MADGQKEGGGKREMERKTERERERERQPHPSMGTPLPPYGKATLKILALLHSGSASPCDVITSQRPYLLTLLHWALSSQYMEFGEQIIHSRHRGEDPQVVSAQHH